MPIRLKTDTLAQVFLHLAAIGVLSALGLCIFFFVYLPQATHSNQTATVPSLVGMSQQEAHSYLQARSLSLFVKDSVFSASQPEGIILAQYPPPESAVKAGRKIQVSLSTRKAPLVSLPEVERLSFESASLKLQKAGFVIEKIIYEPSAKLNTVIALQAGGKRLKAKEKIAQGTSLEVIVGGFDNRAFEAPQLIGLSQEDAEFVLKALGLEPLVQYVFREDADLGTVLQQQPPAFRWKEGKKEATLVKAGEIIEIWVAGNPAPAPEDSPSPSQP